MRRWHHLQLVHGYSIASPSWDEELEFYSIKVPDGPLTSKLQHIKAGDQIILRPKPVGTLVLDALLPGKRLWFFATGTGIAPFASLMRDPDTYERYDEVIMMHCCRDAAELEYGRQLVESLPEDPLIGEFIGDKLKYYPTTTRDDFANKGRITTNLTSGKVFSDLGLGIDRLDPETDRGMVCGSAPLQSSSPKPSKRPNSPSARSPTGSGFARPISSRCSRPEKPASRSKEFRPSLKPSAWTNATFC